MLSPQNLDRPVRMPNLDVIIGVVELDLIGLEVVNLAYPQLYIDPCRQRDLIDLFLLEIVKHDLIRQGLLDIPVLEVHDRVSILQSYLLGPVVVEELLASV